MKSETYVRGVHCAWIKIIGGGYEAVCETIGVAKDLSCSRQESDQIREGLSLCLSLAFWVLYTVFPSETFEHQGGAAPVSRHH